VWRTAINADLVRKEFACGFVQAQKAIAVLFGAASIVDEVSMTLIERGCGLDMESIGNCGRWPSDQHGLFSELEETSRDSALDALASLPTLNLVSTKAILGNRMVLVDHGCSEVLRLQQTNDVVSNHNISQSSPRVSPLSPSLLR
jgi:hypothetical protein